MSDRLSVIRTVDGEAARVLEEKDARSDWELEILTREDLAELFPGPEQFQRRGKIFDVINTQKSVEELLREVKEFIPGENLTDAPAVNQVLLDYIYILKDQKDQLKNILECHDAHINFLENIMKNTPQWESEKGSPTTVEVKSDLLSDINNHNENAANVLKKAGIRSDWELKALTREDLRELFQGSDQLKLRGMIYKIIKKQKPVGELITKVKKFIPEQFLKDALTDNGVLVDYLRILKDQRVHMKNVQDFHDAHISYFENIRNDTPQTEFGEASCATNSDQIDGHPPTEQNAPSACAPTVAPTHSAQRSVGKTEGAHRDILENSVRFKMVVSGKTFGAHEGILDKVKEQVLLENKAGDHQITILFCVISSRVGSDVDAALAEVKDNKPIILVLMHHSREPTVTTSVRTWAHDGNDANIILHVDVFYHETCGLLKCQQNDVAFSMIQNKLLKIHLESKSNTDLHGTPQAKKGRTGSESGTNDNSGWLGLFRKSK